MKTTSIIKTIGELIHDTRFASNITITQLSELSGINKGTISRIEKSEIKRPDFSTVRLLTTSLGIPFETLVDYYVEGEKRSDLLFDILQATIKQKSSNELIRKVAVKYLKAPNEDSVDLTEKLYKYIGSIEDTSMKLSLYDLIIEHSRSHGIMPYIAKGLYQKYLIERNDFMRMKGTYFDGKYVIHYIDFLSKEERIELYYKLGIHTYNLRLYNESVEYCKKVFVEDDDSSSPYRVHAIAVLRDCFFALGEYKESEIYSIQYKQFNYPNTQEHVVLMDALYKAVKGNEDQAIKELKSFFETCSDAFILPAARHLIRLCLDQNRIDDVKIVLESGRVNSSIMTKSNPLTYYGYGEFLKLQGDYYLAIGEIEKCINALMDGALCFSKISDTIKEKECLHKILHIHLENNTSMSKDILEKLSDYYSNSTK